MTGPAIVPQRITAALNLRRLYGPQVDIDCGAREPDVDRWEDPDDLLLPDARQLALLAELTGFPAEFFYQPWNSTPSQGIICWGKGNGRKRGQRCEPVEFGGDPQRPAADTEPGQIALFHISKPRPVGRNRD